MKLAINIDNLEFVLPENPAALARQVAFRRNDVLPIEVLLFNRNQNRVELPEGATGSIQVNEAETFGGDGIASDSDVEKIGSGHQAEYHFELDFSGAAVSAAFPDNETKSVSGILEIKFEYNGAIVRTSPLSVTLQNAIQQA